MAGKSNNRRPTQVGEAIQHQLSDLLLRGIKDPRLGFVTIMGVEVSPDLKHARVFVSVMGTAEEQQASMEVLERARGWLRHELGGRMALRYMPELQFRADHTTATADRINRLLHEVGADGDGNKEDLYAPNRHQAT